jgi:hypothetical protein
MHDGVFVRKQQLLNLFIYLEGRNQLSFSCMWWLLFFFYPSRPELSELLASVRIGYSKPSLVSRKILQS